MSMSPEFGIMAAFLFGLFGSLAHCPAMCGGFAAGVALRGQNAVHNAFARSLAYHSGRVLTYTFVGALVGLTGSLVNAFGGLSEALRSGATYLGGGFMLVTGVSLLLGTGFLLEKQLPGGWVIHRASRLLGRSSWPASFHLGLLLGFLPCGLVYSAASYALAQGDPIAGGLTLLAFGLGTIPALAATALLASSLQRYGRFFQIFAGALLVASGTRFLWFGFAG